MIAKVGSDAEVLECAVNDLYRVQLSEAASIQVIVDRVKAKIAQAEPGEWVTEAPACEDC